MADVKLGVSADFGGVTSGLNSIGQEATKLGATLSRGMTYKPFDLKAVERDLKRYEQLVRDMQKRINALTRAPGGAGGAGGLPAPAPAPSLLPALLPPALPPPSPFLRSRTPRGRHAYTFSPDVSDIGRSLMGGFGGGVGTISQYATRGAVAGSREGGSGPGGMLGGGMGLLKGSLIGAGVLGAMKIGQGVSEGYDMAKERNTSLDELKRQMGDLGVSFNSLKEMSNLASEGLNINQKEAAKLAVEFNQLSHGAEKNAEGLTGAVRSGVGLSQAYGLQPSAGVGFLGGMRQLDPRQNNRELAVMLAETLNKSHMEGNAGEVMQAIQSLAASTARLSLSIPNVSGFAGTYGSLMGSGTSGMTHDGAVGMLSQANSAMTRMGAFGEASKNYTFAAINAKGAMNPFDSMALAEGGLFASRRSVFGDPSSANAKYNKKYGIDMSEALKSPNANVTNFESVMDKLDKDFANDPRLKRDAIKNHFGLSSLSNAAALDLIPRGDRHGLADVIRRSGVDINSINTSGLQTVAKIGAAGTPEELKRIYADMGKRTGPGSLTGDDRAAWDKAKGGSMEAMQDALVKIAASKDMQQTEASQTLAGMKAIEKAQTDVGDKLVVPMNTMRDVLVMAFGGGKGTRSIHEKFMQVERDDINGNYDRQSDAVKAKYAALKRDDFSRKPLKDAMRDSVLNNKKMNAELAAINVGRNGELSVVDADGKPITDPAAVAGKPASTVKDAQLMQESGGRHRNADGSLVKSPKGALGISQVLPATGANPGYGIEPLQGQSEADYLRFRDSYMGVATKRYGGDRQKALASYNGGIDRTDKAISKYGDNWFSHMPKETRDYATNIMNAENGTMPMPKQSSQAKQAANDTLHITIEAQQPIHATDGKVVGTKTISASLSKPRGSGASRTVME